MKLEFLWVLVLTCVVVSVVAAAPPVAVDDFYYSYYVEDTIVGQGAPGVLINDYDPDGDAFQAEIVDMMYPPYDITLDSDGSFFIFDPWKRSNWFSYRVTDGSEYSNVAYVYISNMMVIPDYAQITVVDTPDPACPGEIVEYHINFRAQFFETSMTMSYNPADLEFVWSDHLWHAGSGYIIWPSEAFQCGYGGYVIVKMKVIRTTPGLLETTFEGYSFDIYDPLSEHTQTSESTTVVTSFTPEFPTLALPLVSIIGLLLAIVAVRRMR